MFKSSRKKLIAIGCSYTADWNTFPPWPTVLAEMLDMECVNLGDTGSGNDEILAKTIDTVLNEKNIPDISSIVNETITNSNELQNQNKLASEF